MDWDRRENIFTANNSTMYLPREFDNSEGEKTQNAPFNSRVSAVYNTQHQQEQRRDFTE